MTKEKVVLIDGNSLIHRGYHAIPDLTTSEGEHVNGVFGFATIFLKVLEEIVPDYVVVTFDAPGKTFRDEIYEEYKANRPEMDELLAGQLKRIYELVEVFDLPYFMQEGFEADDLLGSLASQLEKTFPGDIYIVTGDLDTLQLVSEKVKVFTSRRGLTDNVIYDRKGVIERYGFPPEKLVEYKGLRGDSSDNIPGVRGVGKKTAQKLLSEFASLEDIYGHLDQVEELVGARFRTALKNGKEEAFLSRKLGRIKTDVPLDFSLADTRLDEVEVPQIVNFFKKLEFNTLLKRLNKVLGKKKVKKQLGLFNENGSIAVKKADFKSILVGEEISLADFLSLLKGHNIFAFDTETTSLKPQEAELVGISFSWEKGTGYYLPLQGPGIDPVDRKDWLAKLKPFLESPEYLKIAHHLKYDWLVLKRHGIEFQGAFFDTMIASYLLNPKSNDLGLKTLSFKELGINMLSIEALIGKGKDQKCFSEVKVSKAADYAARDAEVTWQLFQHYKSLLEKTVEKDKSIYPQDSGFDLKDLFEQLEMPLVEVLVGMEENGIKVDRDKLAELSKSLTQKLRKLEDQIFNLVEKEFNLNSPQQLSAVLFQDLGLKPVRKTKTGYSTDQQTLEKLADEHEVIDYILKYRQWDKILSTYVLPLEPLLDKKGRVYTSFNQCRTTTGRLSSSSPNLQNIPVRGDWGKEIRELFVASEGYTLLAADYSQIELRLAAYFSQDKNMLADFRADKDIHTATACRILGKKEDQVSSADRRLAKTINFAVLYGSGSRNVAQNAGIKVNQARDFIDKYFSVYEGVAQFLEELKDYGRRYGLALTYFGRELVLPDIHSKMGRLKAAAERIAVNMPLQGTAADIMKKAMISVQNNLSSRSSIRLLLQIHDELLLEVKEEKGKEVASELKEIMEKVMPHWPIKLVVNVKQGNSWGSLV